MAAPGRKKTEDRPNVGAHGQRLGALIRVRRDSQELTRVEVANEASVSPQQLASLERGKIGDPGFLLVGRIAEKLGLDLGHMYRVATGREDGQSS